VAVCLVGLAECAREQGDMVGASRFSRRARALYRQLNHIRGQADCCLTLAQIARRLVDPESAVKLVEAALELYKKDGCEQGIANCLRSLGLLHVSSDPNRAAALYERARGIVEKIGHRQNEGRILNDIADLARMQGDLDGAEAGYRKALTLCEATGSGDATVLRINLGLVLIARGEYQEAQRLLHRCREDLVAAGRHLFLGGVHANLLPCVAAHRDWTTWDFHFDEAVSFITRTNLIELDDTWTVQLAGDLALAAGELERARKAYRFARHLWQKLGDSRRVLELDGVLEQLGVSSSADAVADAPGTGYLPAASFQGGPGI